MVRPGPGWRMDAQTGPALGHEYVIYSRLRRRCREGSGAAAIAQSRKPEERLDLHASWLCVEIAADNRGSFGISDARCNPFGAAQPVHRRQTPVRAEHCKRFRISGDLGLQRNSPLQAHPRPRAALLFIGQHMHPGAANGRPRKDGRAALPRADGETGAERSFHPQCGRGIPKRVQRGRYARQSVYFLQAENVGMQAAKCVAGAP